MHALCSTLRSVFLFFLPFLFSPGFVSLVEEFAVAALTVEYIFLVEGNSAMNTLLAFY